MTHQPDQAPSLLDSTRPDREALRCKARPLTGDLSCIYDAGHDQPHRNFQGIEWTMTRCDHPGPAGVTCRLPTGHSITIHEATRLAADERKSD